MDNTCPEKKRLHHIDRLKVFGLLLVMLAHVDLPVWLAQIRSFDVPLLVFASAYLARKTYHKGSIIAYYKKRLVRLAVPAWIFALFFWVVQSVILIPPTIVDVLRGLAFQRDTNMLGMLWIIWVYIVCALLIPVVDKSKNGAAEYSIAIMLLMVYQLLCSFTDLSENRLLYCTVFTVIPYGFITYLGYHYEDMTTGMKKAVSLGSLCAFAMLFILLWRENGRIMPISDYKYPAQLYYLCYAIPFTFALFQIVPAFDAYETSGLVKFISRSSLWIYLWHILVLYAVKMVIENPAYWWLQYLIIVPVSVGITWVQNKVVDWLSTRLDWKLLTVFRG